MIRRGACLLLLLLAWTMFPLAAQTRAWLDRNQITYGETATLNIQTDASVQQIDYRPLQRQFDIAGQTVRRSFERRNGQSVTRSLFAVGIRPRGPGVLTVPALRVGATTTAPQRLTVLPPSVMPASGDADVFIETAVDAAQPYVQQAVGVVVRLHYAVPLMSGQLDQDPPATASLQRVGEDLTYQREIDGRRYNVVERRFLLIPERSGPLVLPGARFNGMTAGGFFDQVFDDGRRPLSAAAPLKRLQVQPIPAGAPQPWLPLHDLRLRYAQAPKRARVGDAATVEIELIADGASAAQLPPLNLPDSDGVQILAEPAQSDEQFIEGRPRTILRRRIALVPLRAGALAIPGPRIEWWDAAQGVARTALLPPLQLDVAAGAAGAEPGPMAPAAAPAASDSIAAGRPLPPRWLPWLLALFAALSALVWWRIRGKRQATDAMNAAPRQAGEGVEAPVSLSQALKSGDLAVIAAALSTGAGLQGEDLDAVHGLLDDPGQRRAVRSLQQARWGGGDAAPALAALRAAFARGARWRSAARQAAPLLPPLYPER